MNVRMAHSWLLIPKLLVVGIPIALGFGVSALHWLMISLLVAVALLAAVFDWILGELRPWLRHDIKCALHAAHAMRGWNEQTRLCMYTPCWRKDKLKQATKYVPTDTYGSGRRGIHSAKGIVGRTYRTNEAQIELVTSSDFDAVMKTNWGFDDKDISKIQRDRRSYICVPVLGANGSAKAVVYADSSKSALFTDNDREELIKVAQVIAQIL